MSDQESVFSRRPAEDTLQIHREVKQNIPNGIRVRLEFFFKPHLRACLIINVADRVVWLEMVFDM